MNLQPGPELNIEISEKLFGYKVYRGVFGKNIERDDGKMIFLEPYSESWDGMQLVAEEMRRRNWQLVLSDDLDKWTAIYFWDPNGASYEAESESAPHAVCMAALSAIEGQADETTKPDGE